MARRTTQNEDAAQRVTPWDDELPEKALADAESQADQLDIADASSILQYGASAQQRISEFAEQVLTHVRVKNVGKVREHLTNLLSKVKNLELPRADKPRGMNRIPFLRRLRLSQDSLTNHYDRVIEKIDRLVPDLNASSDLLLKDVAFFDGLYARNLEHLGELDAFLVVGHRKLDAWAARLAGSAPSDANGGETDARAAERQRDRLRQIEFLRKRLQHLRMARMVSLQLAPEIRLIQDDLKVLAVEAQHAVLTTVPLWKNQIVAAVAMLRQRETSRVARDATHATTEIIAFNSDLIRDSTEQIAHRESEKRTVERDTLDKADTDLDAATAALRAARAKASDGATAPSVDAGSVTPEAEVADAAEATDAASARPLAAPAVAAKSKAVDTKTAKSDGAPSIGAGARTAKSDAATAKSDAATKARAARGRAAPVKAKGGSAKAATAKARAKAKSTAAKAKPSAGKADTAAAPVVARVAARTARMSKGNGHGGNVTSPQSGRVRTRTAKPVRPPESTT